MPAVPAPAHAGTDGSGVTRRGHPVPV